MTETILTSKKIKEFSLHESRIILTSVYAIFSGLPQDFFVRNRPRNAGNGQCQ